MSYISYWTSTGMWSQPQQQQQQPPPPSIVMDTGNRNSTNQYHHDDDNDENDDDDEDNESNYEIDNDDNNDTDFLYPNSTNSNTAPLLPTVVPRRTTGTSNGSCTNSPRNRRRRRHRSSPLPTQLQPQSSSSSSLDRIQPLNNNHHHYTTNIVTTWFQEQYHILYTYGTADIIAGMIVGIMIVPQSMSYAKLAGLPVEYGLYSSLVPVYTYALYGLLPVPHCRPLSSNSSSSSSSSSSFSSSSSSSTHNQNIHSLLAIGPVALISLMLSSGLSKILHAKGISNINSNNNNNEQYTLLYEQLAIQSSFLVGLLCIFMGKCQYQQYNLGTILTQCLSHTVISAFTSGAAIIIALSQCKYILGYHNVPTADTVPTLIVTLWKNRDQIYIVSLLMGGISLLILLLARHMLQSSKMIQKNARYQRLLTLTPLFVTVMAVICTTLVFPLLPQQHYHVMIVGIIPRGLPHLTIPSFPMTVTDFLQLLPVVVSITLIGFMETIAIAKQLVSKQQQYHHHQREMSDGHSPVMTSTTTIDVDTSQEFIALGLSNVFGSLFHSYPVAGSFSRSAMNYSAGGQTRYAGFVTACMVAMALLILTPFFEQLPYNTLAAMVISGVVGLFDYKEVILLWQMDRIECIVWCISCGCTMCFGCEYGLSLAIASSFLATLYRMTFVPITVLGHVPGTVHYRNTQICPEAQPIDGIIILRICGPIYFANIPYIERTIQTLISHSTTTGHNLNSIDIDETTALSETDSAPHCFVIVDMSSVVYMDTTALRRLKHILTTTQNIVQFCLTDVSKHILQQLETTILVESTIGRDQIFASIHDAVQHCTVQRPEQQQQLQQQL